MTIKSHLVTCIVCPQGCQIQVRYEDGFLLEIKGNRCKRGKSYAWQEIQNPQRILTTTVRVIGGELPLVSVKTDRPIPKELIFKTMDLLAGIELKAPVKMGQVVLDNILGTGTNVVATKTVKKQEDSHQR